MKRTTNFGAVVRIARALWKPLAIAITISVLRVQQGAWAEKTNPPGNRPNVVLVLADDLGYGDLSCYGAPDVKTPNIDRLAGEGVRFTAFYANSPICSPTRSALLSGLYPQHAGVWKGVPARDQKKKKRGTVKERKKERNLGLKEEVTLLPQILKGEGYACGIFGKWHLGGESPNIPNDRGFDSFYGFLGGSSKYGPKHGPTQRLNRKPYDEEGHLTDLFTEQARAFIRENKDRPFFVYIPYNAPHGPIDNAASLIPGYVKKYREHGVDPARAMFCAVVEHMDSGVGRIMETLRKLDLEGKTIVIFTSDNGATPKWSGSNKPLRGQKGQVLEGGIRLPCIVRWPGKIPGGSVADSPAASMDLFSTILDAVGADIPGGVSGVSLLDVMTSGGTEKLPERYLFFELKGRVAARHGNWKIVGDLSDEKTRDRFALYDLGKDLRETRDLSRENPEKLQQLKKALSAWLDTVEEHKGLKDRGQRTEARAVSAALKI